MRGLTDVIKFDHQGFRTDFVLDIVELGPTGLRKTGTWNSTQGVNFTKSYNEHQREIVEILQNRTLVVTTILVSLVQYFFLSLFFSTSSDSNRAHLIA
jgi:glutamate receptor, ionotropic, invertebrate